MPLYRLWSLLTNYLRCPAARHLYIYLRALTGTYIVGEPQWWANLKLAHLRGQAGAKAARLELVADSEDV